MHNIPDPTMPPPAVLYALRRPRRRPSLLDRAPTWRLSQAIARANVEYLVTVLSTTPQGEHAPPYEVLEALRRGRAHNRFLLHGRRQSIGSGPGPNGGTQRIIHRTSYAAFDDTVRRIARRKAAEAKAPTEDIVIDGLLDDDPNVMW